MALTDAQRRAVECTGRPLFIQAGAGTGKTFTLTKRLAAALADGRIPGVDNLLTITFTNKAAAELTSRVRAELRADGLIDEALAVDAAWISTIHAMCQRMLVAHAFEVGIDPGAQLLDEMESDELLVQAVDAVLEAHAGSEQLELLLGAYSKSEKLCAAITSVVKLFSTVPDAAASFDVGPAPARTQGDIVADVYGAYRSARDELAAIKFAEANKTSAKCYGYLVDYTDALAQTVACDLAEDMSWAELLELLEQVPTFKHSGIKKQPQRSILDECCERVDALYAYACAAYARELACALLAFADEAYGVHGTLKRARGALDIGDVLVQTQRLLVEHDDVAAAYRSQFASVMVDEFQDTDRLQVAIVKRLCDSSLATLATVGDAQQSIYGFRGADLEVYREMRAEMAEMGAESVALDVNFRSHSGILRFVESVFSTSEFFGGEFLRVTAGPANDADRPWAGRDEARVHVHIVGGKKDADEKSPGIDELRRTEAQVIADEFEALAARGAAYGDMAVLLRKMSNAGIYRDALRERGIPCIVSGGSLFYSSPEVLAVTMLLRFLENCDDDEATFALLGSRLFDLGDDDLLWLATVRADRLRVPAGSMRRRPSLFDALGYVATHEADTCSGDVTRAYDVLETARQQAASMPFSAVVERALIASGYYDTLRMSGLDGMSVQANIWKLCSLIDECERHVGHSIVKVAERFRGVCERVQDGTMSGGKPATMGAEHSGAVQIMTFHAAKGLEFPIVAVAEYESGGGPSGAGALNVSEDGQDFLSMKLSGPRAAKAGTLAAAEGCPGLAFASDPLSFAGYARELAAQREHEESQRLLYVALTRAKDTLIVLGHDKAYGDDGVLADGAFASMMRAAFGETLPRDGSIVRTATGALVAVHAHIVQREADDDAGHGEVGMPAPAMRRFARVSDVPPAVSARSVRTSELHSYSSISKRVEQPAQLVPAMVCLRGEDETDDEATAFGSAFHLVAQWLLDNPKPQGKEFSSLVVRAAQQWGLTPERAVQLGDAVHAWLSSSLYADTLRYERRFAEYAFCVYVRDVALEGFIDLLCLDAESRSALVVDYKTGMSGSAEELQWRYLLQASCYAYAVLASGECDRVELVFVRPEAGLQEIRYRFTADDMERLELRILA